MKVVITGAETKMEMTVIDLILIIIAFLIWSMLNNLEKKQYCVNNNADQQ